MIEQVRQTLRSPRFYLAVSLSTVTAALVAVPLGIQAVHVRESQLVPLGVPVAGDLAAPGVAPTISLDELAAPESTTDADPTADSQKADTTGTEMAIAADASTPDSTEVPATAAHVTSSTIAAPDGTVGVESVASSAVPTLPTSQTPTSAPTSVSTPAINRPPTAELPATTTTLNFEIDPAMTLVLASPPTTGVASTTPDPSSTTPDPSSSTTAPNTSSTTIAGSTPTTIAGTTTTTIGGQTPSTPAQVSVVPESSTTAPTIPRIPSSRPTTSTTAPRFPNPGAN